MWFRMPEGTSGVSVELQEFKAEAKDEAGFGYFRAPAHFAPRILAIPGFLMAEPPEGAPPDLPQPDPLRDGAISDLTRAQEALKMENTGLRTDLEAANARLRAMETSIKELQGAITARDIKIAALEEQIEDAPAKKAK